MLPNMKNTALAFSQLLTFQTATQTIVDYVPVMSYITSKKRCTIYTSKPDEINSFIFDRTLSYYTVISADAIDMKDLLLYKDKTFKQINKEDFREYGFYRALYEEVKNA